MECTAGRMIEGVLKIRIVQSLSVFCYAACVGHFAAGAFVDDRGSAGGRHGCRSVGAGNYGHIGEFCVAVRRNDDLTILFVAVSWRKKVSEGTAV